MLEIPALTPTYRVIKLKPLKKNDSHAEQQLPQKRKQAVVVEHPDDPVQHIDEIA